LARALYGDATWLYFPPSLPPSNAFRLASTGPRTALRSLSLIVQLLFHPLLQHPLCGSGDLKPMGLVCDNAVVLGIASFHCVLALVLVHRWHTTD